MPITKYSFNKITEKSSFGKYSKSFIRAVAKQLEAKGWIKEALYWNKGGEGVWGDVVLLYWKQNSEYGIYISLSGFEMESGKYQSRDFWSKTNVPQHAIMYRATKKGPQKWTGFGNRFAPNNIVVDEFVSKIVAVVDDAEAKNMNEKVFYELDCPHCQTSFEKSEDKIGKPPFVVDCPECGKKVDENFIVTTINAVDEEEGEQQQGDEFVGIVEAAKDWLKDYNETENHSSSYNIDMKETAKHILEMIAVATEGAEMAAARKMIRDYDESEEHSNEFNVQFKEEAKDLFNRFVDKHGKVEVNESVEIRKWVDQAPKQREAIGSSVRDMSAAGEIEPRADGIEEEEKEDKNMKINESAEDNTTSVTEIIKSLVEQNSEADGRKIFSTLVMTRVLSNTNNNLKEVERIVTEIKADKTPKMDNTDLYSILKNPSHLKQIIVESKRSAEAKMTLKTIIDLVENEAQELKERLGDQKFYLIKTELANNIGMIGKSVKPMDLTEEVYWEKPRKL